MKTMKWLASIVGKRIWRVALLCVLQGLLVLDGILFTLFMRSAFDAATRADLSSFLIWAFWMIAVILLQLLLRAANRLLEEDTRAVVENAVRLAVFGLIFEKDYRTVCKTHSGTYMNYLTSDVTVVAEGMVSLIPTVCSMACKVIGILLVMARLLPVLSLVFLLGGILVVFSSLIPRKKLKQLHAKVQEAEGSLRCYLQECLESMLIIRSFHCEKKILHTGADKSEEFRRIRRKRSLVSVLFGTGLSAAMQAGYLIGFLAGGYAVSRGTITYGTLVALISLIGQIQTPFVSFGSLFPRAASFASSGERLMQAAGEAQPRADKETEKHLPEEEETRRQAEQTLTEKAQERQAEKSSEKMPGHQVLMEIGTDCRALFARFKMIQGEKISFSYDGRREVLHRESFHIERGETVAMVGTSGIGKSTLMKLLLQVYQPSEGKIELTFSSGNETRENTKERIQERIQEGIQDGTQEVCRMRLEELPPGLFAYVPQGNQLMSGSIREIVGFAEQSDNIQDDRVQWALWTACAQEFVEELPEGVETVLGEKGAGLSEGQMQRLAVARALYSECPVLLLDEATSALDPVTERHMLERIRSIPDRTVLIVTHRPEVWQVCDRIIRLGDET